jgi:YD repeat-containing protein
MHNNDEYIEHLIGDDEQGRVIYEKKQSDNLIEEWWYEYDDEGKRIITKYYEESICGDTYTEFI